jgi:hypothetical protein
MHALVGALAALAVQTRLFLATAHMAGAVMVTTSQSKSNLAKLTFDPKRVGIKVSKSKFKAAIGLLLFNLFKDDNHANYEINTTNLTKPYKSNYDYLASTTIGTDPVVLMKITESGERGPACLKDLSDNYDHHACTTTSPTTLLSLLKSALEEDTVSDLSTAVVLNQDLKFGLNIPAENSRLESISNTHIRKHDIHCKNSLKDTNHCKTWLKDTYHSKNSL